MEAIIHGRFSIAYNPMPLESALEAELKKEELCLGPLELEGRVVSRWIYDSRTNEKIGCPTIQHWLMIGKNERGGGGYCRKGIPSIGYLMNFLRKGAEWANTRILAKPLRVVPGGLDEEAAVAFSYYSKQEKGVLSCQMSRNRSDFASEISVGTKNELGGRWVEFPSAENLANRIVQYLQELRKEG